MSQRSGVGLRVGLYSPRVKIGFCGLGQMGAPMARRLLEAGNEMVVWNRSTEKTDPLVAAGATGADSPAETATGVDAVVTMLATPDALEEVVFGDRGIAEGIGPPTTLIEMSTVGPEAITTLTRRLPGIEVVDAPVLGSVPEAEEGMLRVFVGATEENFERVRGLLTALGEPIHVGLPGSGAAMKLVVNSTLGALQLAFGEALALADAIGLDPSMTLNVLENSSIASTVRKKREKIESGVFEANFKLSLAAKDMALVDEAARAAGLDLRGAGAARRAFDAANQAGLGDCDYSAVVAFLSGREARSG